MRGRSHVAPLGALVIAIAACSAAAVSPSPGVGTPSPSAAPPSASVAASASVAPSAAEQAMPTPAPTPPGRTPAPDTHVVTRIQITALRIDLPVIAGSPAVYTPCGVALYLPELRQPGQGGAVYVYAHARKGMFLPILDAVTAGRQLAGMTVELFTSDAFLYRYTISDVRRHQRDMNAALAASTEQLWLQTGEGPAGTRGNIQLVGLPDGTPTAVTEREAHPKPRPVACP